MPRPLLLLASTLAVTVALAQPPTPPARATGSTANPGAQTAQYTAPTIDQSGCPVGFSVERRSATELLSAESAAERQDAQGLRILFDSQPGKKPVSADVLVHGVTSHPTFTLVANAADDHEVTRSFHLERAHHARLESSEIWVDHVGSIRSVDLIAIHFADGTDWHSPAVRSCSAEPSLFLTVAAH